MLFRFVPILLSAPVLLATTAAQARDFECSNEGLAEIGCAEGLCRMEPQSFTAIRLSRTGNEIDVCAYSGCWSATVKPRKLSEGRELFDAVLTRYSLGAPDPMRALVIYNPDAQAAQLQFAGYFLTMGCGVPDPEAADKAPDAAAEN